MTAGELALSLTMKGRIAAVIPCEDGVKVPSMFPSGWGIIACVHPNPAVRVRYLIPIVAAMHGIPDEDCYEVEPQDA